VIADTAPGVGQPGVERSAPSSAAKRSAHALLALILLIETIYAAYLCDVLRPSALEQRYLDIAAGRTFGSVPPFAALLATVQALTGGGQTAGRALSIVAMLFATWIAYSVGRRATNDPVCGAALALPFALFPPLTATYAAAMPHALVAAFAFALLHDGFATHTSTQGAASRVFFLLKYALIALIAAMLHPLGSAIVVIGVVIGGALAGWSRSWRLKAATAVVVAIAVTASGLAGRLPREPDLAEIGHATLVTALIKPYGMIWTGFFLSGVTLAAGATRARLGKMGLQASILAILATVIAPVAMTIFDIWTPGQFVTGMGYLFPLSLIGFLPLLIWIRWVMPTVTAFWAWVVFPVVMYSCFWVVLGPINEDQFPYAVRAVAADAP